MGTDVYRVQSALLPRGCARAIRSNALPLPATDCLCRAILRHSTCASGASNSRLPVQLPLCLWLRTGRKPLPVVKDAATKRGEGFARSEQFKRREAKMLIMQHTGFSILGLLRRPILSLHYILPILTSLRGR